MKRKNFLKVLLVFGMVFPLTIVWSSTIFAAAAKDFPNRQIEIVVPNPAAGMVDLAIRAISDELSKNLGVPVVIQNKPGAGFLLGAQYVAQSKSDGYTILGAPSALFLLVPAMQPDSFKISDFIPIARYATIPHVLIVQKGAPWKTFEELITYAKKNPGKLTCGSAGVG
ncbi:MAG: tripartite tricarboxylate transporter substrate-binding protein, partial [Deltaproteobacteria bacterium]